MNRILVDTQSLIWATDAPGRLSTAAAAALRNPAIALLVGVGVIWEIAIKVGIGKLTLSGPYRPWVHQALTTLGAQPLPVTLDYTDALIGLPHHHRDPFDRLLVAQAIVEGVPIVSSDAQLDAYGITRIW